MFCLLLFRLFSFICYIHFIIWIATPKTKHNIVRHVCCKFQFSFCFTASFIISFVFFCLLLRLFSFMLCISSSEQLLRIPNNEVGSEKNKCQVTHHCLKLAEPTTLLMLACCTAAWYVGRPSRQTIQQCTNFNNTENKTKKSLGMYVANFQFSFCFTVSIIISFLFVASPRFRVWQCRRRLWAMPRRSWLERA